MGNLTEIVTSLYAIFRVDETRANEELLTAVRLTSHL